MVAKFTVLGRVSSDPPHGLREEDKDPTHDSLEDSYVQQSGGYGM